MFDGDDYDALQWHQHEAYQQALSILVGEAKSRLGRAEALLGPSAFGDLIRRDEFDHHVLQDVHDLIAAIWRRRHGYVQEPLPLPGQHVEKYATEWLVWLRAYAADDMDDGMMRSVLILGYLDPDPDHSEERFLLGELRERLASEVRNATSR